MSTQNFRYNDINMRTILKPFAFFVGVVTIATILLIGYDYYQNISNDSGSEKSQQEADNYSEISPTPLERLSTSAWIPYWDYDRGLQTLKDNPGQFDSILPVIYELNENGSLKMTKGRTWEPLQEYSEENDIEFIASIAMFDHELFTPVMQDKENFDRHIDAIITEVEENDFDGIDLDYESTKLDDEEQYREFVAELSTKLQTRDKKLIVTVLPKWLPDFIYPNLNETRSVQDWQFLGRHADEVRIMAYDYTSQQSAKPGPVAPIDWVEMILKKAIKEIPHEKIVLGLNNYGYNWAASDINPETSFLNNPATGEIKADAYTYDQIQEIKEKYGGDGEESIYEPWQEVVLRYKREGNDRVLVYPTAETAQARIELAGEYGIKGFSYWRLGGDSEFEY
ncbi:hypothetical protein GF389_02345 [Candidatus Dojkabacteria bacterium]|nr:hypothetical protein [Candidatus Dojkabacteria bacterium]